MYLSSTIDTDETGDSGERGQRTDKGARLKQGRSNLATPPAQPASHVPQTGTNLDTAVCAAAHMQTWLGHHWSSRWSRSRFFEHDFYCVVRKVCTGNFELDGN